MTLKYTGRDLRDPTTLSQWLGQKQPEPILEPDLPIVDCHVHLWDRERGRYMLDELRADLSTGHNVTAVVFEECEAMYRAGGPAELRPVGEVEFVRGIAAMAASGQYGPARITGIVAAADFSLGARVRDVLEAEIDAGGGLVRGIRSSMPWDPNPEINDLVGKKIPPGRLLDPTYREGIAQLAPLDLVYDVWIYFTQIPELVALARALPDLRIVINHCGGPICVGPYLDDREGTRQIWLSHMRELAQCPNVSVKLGGLGMSHFGFPFLFEDFPPGSAELAQAWRPYLEPCVDLFGVERSMLESNFPPDRQSCTYADLWNAFKRVFAAASSQEKAALFGDTAKVTYGLR